MASRDPRKRSELPNSAFAYIDSKGRRRLPIHDESHVRNALARFNQTAFEDGAARERAQQRVLKAAKKYGIVPIGFMTGQLRSLAVENERLQWQVQARASDGSPLTAGFVTFLLTDIEDSTGLLRELRDGYGSVLDEVRELLRLAIRENGGREVDARADEFFAVFERGPAALDAALAIQRRLGDRAWPTANGVRVRIGLHSGEPTVTDSGYVGLDVHTAARVCYAGHGGQILATRPARDTIEASRRPGIDFRNLGDFRLHGLPEPETLFQVEAEDLQRTFPAPRTDAGPAATAQVATWGMKTGVPERTRTSDL